jgi:chromosome segregation protein
VRLTQIKLSGFKSFVDPTSIQIPGQLVGVVGPNGCGKSNVIDAVRWVLGESRASALRGDSMQDVIFNGSVHRKPLARASVELIFDNSQGRAAGQWSQYAEISVKRTLQRDGESSYYINGTHVRRRDITDMFLGTGLGPRAYAIIEQGMISRVIEAKPEELRVFLEEAAGISRYKERRRETENRLADTRENLARVTDIRLELGAQLEKLEGQAKVATRYKEYHSDLQLKQHLLWYLRRRDAAAERDRHRQELSRITNELESHNAELRSVESRVEGARAAHYKAGDSMNESQGALYAANAEVARFESELRHAEETRSRLEGQHTERRAQLASWRQQRSDLTQSLHAWAAKAVEARQRVAERRERLGVEAAALPQAEQAFREAQARLDATRSALSQAEHALGLEQANFAHLERGRQALENRRERLEGELQTLSLSDSARQNLDDLQGRLSSAEERRAAAAELLSAAQREHAAAGAQLATLRQVQAAAEDNAPLAEWLQRHGLGSAAQLWQKLRIDHGWETAVESVLRERLHALELDGAGKLATVLADRPPTRASVFDADTESTLLPMKGAALAAKVHSADPAVTAALSDWLAGVIAVEGNPDRAQRDALTPGAVLVNREGHQFTRHTVSFHAPDAHDAGLLERAAEIEALEQRGGELAARLKAAESSAQALDGEVKALHDARIDGLKLAQAQERGSQIRAELDEVRDEAARGKAAADAAQAAATRIAAQIGELRTQADAAREALGAAESRLAAQRAAQQQAEREAQDALFGERECSSKIAEIDNAVRVIDQQISRADAELTRLNEELAADPIPGVREALEKAVAVRISSEKQLSEARNAVEAAAGVLRELEEAKLQVEARAAPLRDKTGELRLKEQAAQINFDQFDTQLREAGANEELLAAEAAAAPRASSLQGEITRITQAINELGAVNLAALEELRTSQERKQFLDAQATDLDEAVNTLEDAIRRIDRESRELLRETFDTVNQHLGKLFPTLFGGGDAKLTMTGEEILDAGVQVMAHPPGKRNTTIHLLSGGEKALTAISLVFALFQLNPAPFCLLDEVDAPLDDSNTLRFCDLVKRMSAQTQFLFISHNKISMEMASQLVGVTMPESGVSRVVAVDIEEALRIREELAA